jgi:hypothetical protein
VGVATLVCMGSATDQGSWVALWMQGLSDYYYQYQASLL